MRCRMLLLSLLVAGAAFAQTVPQHKRLLYSDSLTSVTSSKMGLLTNKGGEFLPGRGWKASTQNSQLIITLPADLPPEGTFIINVTNFDPVSQSVDAKQNILSMASHLDMYSTPQYETGSWWLYRTGTGYTDGPGMAGFRIDYASRGVDTRSDGRAMQSSTWNYKRTYEFKVVWQASWISFYVDGNLIMDPKISGTGWSGQSQFFRYIFVGRDSKGYPGQPGPIWFNARVYVPGPALAISKVSGDGQSAYTSALLPAPLVVKVADLDGAAQANIPVTFSFTSGSGQMVEAQPLQTDANGLASVHVRLGSVAGPYALQAVAEGASGSPVAFSAVATNPTIGLRKVSGDGQSGPAGGLLATSLIVKAVYKEGAPVANEPVLLQTLNGGSVDGQASVTRTTNAEGLVSVNWTLGPAAGVQRLRAAHGDSLVEFTATATLSANQSLQLLSGGGQNGAPGQALAAPVVVQVRDEFGNPAAGQSLLFAVSAGGGTLGGQISRSILTDAEGKAAAQWSMGPYRGVRQLLQISGTVNSAPLGGSPLTVEAGLGAAPDAALSTLSATSPVTANGSDASHITVTVRDSVGQALSGYIVRLAVSGSGNRLSVPDSLSNAAGQVTATLTSTVSGSKTITARVIGANVLLNATASVQFDPVPQTAASIQMLSGNNQSGVAGTLLAQPLVVKVINDQGAAAAGYPVTFTVASGHGTLDGEAAQTVLTDAQGQARVSLTLGTVIGTATVRATTAPLATIITYTAKAVSGPAYKMTALSGFSQSGTPGKSLANPVVVAVTDLHDNPVAGYSVLFKAASGGGSVAGASQAIVATDVQGSAAVYWTLGRYLGALNQLVISGTNSESVLAGAPLLMEIAQPVLPEVTLSTVTATTPVVADGVAWSDLTVQLLDPAAQPLAGFTVDITATGSNNTLMLTDSLSDRDGKVRARLRSTTAELKVIGAAVKGAGYTLRDTAQVRFTAPSVLDQLLYISGNDQTGRIGATLPEPLVVRVLDLNKNPKGGVSVEWSVSAGGGLVNRRTACSVYSDTAGYCRVLWSMGQVAGRRNNMLTVRIHGSERTTLTFAASAAATEPAQWTIVSGNQQSGIVGRALAAPLCIRMGDANSNPVADLAVLFKVTQGDASFAGSPEYATKTDAFGQASALLTLGQLATTSQIQVFAGTAPLQPLLFTATAAAEAASRLMKVSRDSQQVALPAADGIGLTVRLTDRFGNGVAGVQVEAASSDGGRLLSAPGVVTNNRGEALFQVRPGDFPGLYHLICQAPGGISTSWSLIAYKQESNRAPVIAAFAPADTALTLVSPGAALEFRFDTVLDPDGDNLRFEWRVNDAVVSTGQALALVVNATLALHEDGLFTVTGSVSDSKLATAVHWRFILNRTGVAVEETPLLPRTLELTQNYPNPFNSSTTFSLALPQRTRASLRIFNLSGEAVQTLFEGELAAGQHRFNWQGGNSRGEAMPSGVYYGVLQAGGERQTRKIVLMR